MVCLSCILEFFKRILKPKAVRRSTLITAGLLILLFVIESGLNFWIRSGLRSSLVADTARGYKIDSKVSWLGLGDIFRGRVNHIRVNVRNCSLNELRYSKLLIDSQGFRFNLPVFLKEKRLEIIEMRKTQINGVIDEQALNDYLSLRYPEYQSTLKIKPGGLILSGSAHILNKIIPVKLEGDLRVISEKRLRFYPTRLLIANSNISGSLLRIVSEQVPLEFGIMEGWPLIINDFILEEKKIKVAMEESKT